MSSKSRNKPSRQERHAPAKVKDEDGSEHHEPTAEEFLEAEELLKTPKGRSPLTYAFLIFLLIFLLVVFLAWDAFYALGQQRGVNDIVMRWEHPSLGQQQVKLLDFERMSRTLAVTSGRRDVEPEEVASFMVADALAEDAGVVVSNAELIENLRGMVTQMGGIDQYRRQIDRINVPGGVKAFEETVRKMMRLGRYRALLGSMGTLPDPASIEETWIDRHQLRTFDYTYTTIAEQRDVAFSQNPDDATLEAWLAGRPAFEQKAYESPAKVRVELVGAVFGEGEPTFDALLAAYPAPEDSDPLEEAKAYYDRAYFARFKRPVALDPPTDGSPDDFATRLYFPFEEVQEQCLREAPVWSALQAWRADLDADLAAGEPVDLAAEAERLGLTHQAPEEPLTQSELRELDGLGGVYIAGALTQLQTAGEIAPGVTIGADGLTVGRLVEKLEASIPPIAEIRDQVLEAWADQRAAELASEVLAGVRASLDDEAHDEADVDTDDGADDGAGDGAEGSDEDGSGEDAASDGPLVCSHDEFAAAVQAAGLPLERVANLDRNAQVADEDALSPAERFLRARSELYSFELGQVSEPVKGFEGDRVYLVRYDSVRDPDPSAMTAKDFQQLFAQEQQLAQFTRQLDDPLSIDRLRERYDLWLISDDLEDEDEDAATEGGDS